MELFADNLPGLPDNIRQSKSGGYWVGTAIVRHPSRPPVYDWSARVPFIRRVIAKVSSHKWFIHTNRDQQRKMLRGYN